MVWMVIRASGFVAYAGLAGAAIWGLVVSTKLLGRSASPKNLTYVHESLSVSALIATAVHLVFISIDEYIEFTPGELFVPGASDWRPVAVSLGIVAFFGLAVLTASFYVRTRIGQSAWRYLHYTSFGVFAAALMHGLAAGTDTGSVIGMGIYISTATAVVGLIVIRVVTVGSGRSEARPRPLRSVAPDEVPATITPPAERRVG